MTRDSRQALIVPPEMISNARVTAYTVFLSRTKASKVNPSVKASIASMFSRISLSRWAGFLEGIHGVAQD